MELKGKVEEEEVKEEAKRIHSMELKGSQKAQRQARQTGERIHSMELKAMLLPVFCPISNPMLEFIEWN